MKKSIYFILAVITIAYIGVLCYANIAVGVPDWISYIEIYGGLAIAFAYAAVNFFGSPLKTVFFVLLILGVVILVLSIVMPEVFRDLFGIVV